MTTHTFNIKHKLGIIFVFLVLAFPSDLVAQRMGHGASRGGGRSMSRPSASRSTPSRSINGGHKASTSRNISKPKTSTNRATTRPKTSTNRATTKPNVSRNKTTGTRPTTSNVKNKKTSTVKNRSTNKVGNNNKVGNKTRVGNNNVNINVNNSRHTNVRNTRVRGSSRAYVRPPYRYGGRGYYCHRPYFYHPYRPFYWGPYYHPWGYFVTTLATTAIIVAIVNDNDDDDNDEYHYENGTYYLKTEDGFEAVQAPVGAQVPSIPKEAETVEVNETNNYYYGGAFYEKNADYADP